MKEQIYPGIYYEGSSVSFDLSIYFSDPDAIPAKVFVESLNGMSMMLEESRHALLKMFDVDCGGKSVLYLDTVRKGSTIEELIVRFFFGSDEEAKQFVDNLRERFKIKKLMDSKVIQSIAISAIVAFALRGVAMKYLDAEKSAPTINATNSIILNAGRDLNMPDGALEKILKECIVNQPKVSKGALMAIQPATLKADTVVKIGGPSGEEIPREVVSSMPPPSVIKLKEEPASYNLDSISIEVMASDIDRRKTGWAVRMPANSPFPGKRISAVLDETVAPSDLMYRKDVKADITVFQDAKGKPQRVLIRNVLAEVEEK